MDILQCNPEGEDLKGLCSYLPTQIAWWKVAPDILPAGCQDFAGSIPSVFLDKREQK